MEILSGPVGVPGKLDGEDVFDVVHVSHEHLVFVVMAAQVVGYGPQQMSLARARGPADDERVVFDLPALGHFPGQGHRKMVFFVGAIGLEGESVAKGKINMADEIGEGHGPGLGGRRRAAVGVQPQSRP
jgi:hypothetical protein